MLLAIKEMTSKDSLEINKHRPSLKARRAVALTLACSLLEDQGILTLEEAKKIEIHRLKSG